MCLLLVGEAVVAKEIDDDTYDKGSACAGVSSTVKGATSKRFGENCNCSDENHASVQAASSKLA